METTRITQHDVVGICYGRKDEAAYQVIDVVIVTAGGTLELTLFSGLDVAVPIVEIEESHGAGVHIAAIEMRKGNVVEHSARRDTDAFRQLCDDIEEYLDDRADADQPVGCSCPIPNEEMSLLVRLRRLRRDRHEQV